MTRLSGALVVAWAVLGVLVVADLAEAQQRGPRRGAPGGGGFMMGRGGGGLVGLLGSPQIQDEIDLVDEQKDKLDALRERVMTEMRGQFSGMQDLNADEREQRMRQMQQQREKQAKKLQDEVDRILMPHQKKRLEEIQAIVALRRGGTRGFASDAVAKALGLSESQTEKIRRIGEETREKLEAAQREIAEAAKKQAMQVLTPQQKEIIEKLEKDKFELESPRMGPGGRQRGDRQRGDRQPGGPQQRPARNRPAR